jgi:ABC-type lipoprotein release transport system permease subunit
MDSALAFINLPKAQQLLQIGGNVHEIAIVFNDLQAASDAGWSFWRRYSQGGNEAVGWGRLFPDLESVVGIMHNVVFISALILFGIVSFGILNTLFMSLYERMFEFGVLRAIGTRPVQVAGILFLEACCLAAISIVIGDALGWGVCSYFAWAGIDLHGLAVSGVTFQDPIYPVVQPIQYVKYPLWLFGFTALIGLYPAIYAARLLPAKAMKRSL